VRIVVILGCCAALLLAACGGSKPVVTTGPTSTTPSTPTTATTVPTGSSTTAAGCPAGAIPMTPVTGPTTTNASLLTNVHEVVDACRDEVVFDFTAKGTDPPGFSLTYGTPPFADSGSGAPVAVAGGAFVVVTIKPGYGYDFVAGTPTYTGPKSVPVPQDHHVRAIVETGDFEGVLNWVIGLDTKRPFSVQATGTPKHQLIVTIS
jgi:hypothetical protein